MLFSLCGWVTQGPAAGQHGRRRASAGVLRGAGLNGVRFEEVGGVGHRVVVRLVFVTHGGDEVAARVEVIDGFRLGGGGQNVVVGHQVAFLELHQLALLVVVVDGDHVPAVLVDVDAAQLEGVAHVRLVLGLDHPHAVQLVTRKIRVDVVRRGDVVVLGLRTSHLVGVVRNVHFLLAHQLPGEALEHPVVHVHLVVELVTVGAFIRVVTANRRSAANALQRRRVQPRRTTVGPGTGLLVHQDVGAGDTGR